MNTCMLGRGLTCGLGCLVRIVLRPCIVLLVPRSFVCSVMFGLQSILCLLLCLLLLLLQQTHLSSVKSLLLLHRLLLRLRGLRLLFCRRKCMLSSLSK